MADLALLFPSELRILKLLWDQGDLTASQLAKYCQEEVGWNRNTTYTVIKKCGDKGFLKRIEPRFLCHALISREEVRQYALQRVVDELYGNPRVFLADVRQQMRSANKKRGGGRVRRKVSARRR